MRRKKNYLFLALAAVTLVLTVVLATIFSKATVSPEPPTYGVTFSLTYSDYLGFDWREGYIAVLDDLQVRKIRIPVHWSWVESEEGSYYFEDIDWMMDEASARGAEVTLVTGLKVPRWPECFIPEWARHHTREEYHEDVLELVRATVERYRHHPALERWQVENEPFFPFGICPDPDPERLYAELELVRALDPRHPIQRTTSGEQAIWLFNVQKADILGVSLYRKVYSPLLGYWVFPIPPAYYALHAKTVAPFVDKLVISELQAEPWLPPDAHELTTDQRYELFTQEDLLNYVNYAEGTGAEEIFFWGVEWWYDLKQEGRDELWQTGKELFRNK